MEAPAQRTTLDAGANPPSQSLKLLVETGLALARERSLDALVQTALDAGHTLCDAEWGAFLSTHPSSTSAEFAPFHLTGAALKNPEAFPLHRVPRRMLVSLFHQDMMRCADISEDAHFGPQTPFAPLTHGPLPAHSYFGIAVRSEDRELLGGFIFCHPSARHFLPEQEPLLEALATLTGAALDNFHIRSRMEQDKDIADRRLRQALDAAQLGTWTWDRLTDLIDMDARAAELYRTPSGEPVTRSSVRDRVVLDEDQDLTRASLQHAVETGTPYRAEYRLKGEGSTSQWLTVSGIPTFAPNSREVIGMVGTVQDITLRKSQEDSLRQSEKLAATGRLAATIAHEINNPLEAVTNLIYLVKTDPAVPSFAQSMLETADQELARVAQIAQQTLGFYRDTTRPTNMDIGELIRGVVTLFQRKLTYKQIEVKLDLSPGLIIYGLQGELRQVFSNLIVNAIDASFQGRILIRARQIKSNGVDGVSILICDEGTGIPQNARRHLFSPFFTTKVEIGTGLGLWVTRGIVEKQGGSVRFRTNTTSPSGTIFRVFLRSSMQISMPDASQQKFLQ